MKATSTGAMCLLSCLLLCGVVRGDLAYHCVDLTAVANVHFQNYYGGAENMPTGEVILGGVAFYIPEGNNGWGSNQGTGTFQADIEVNLFGVREVHTLINTLWGQVGPYTRLEFFGDEGAYLAKDLYGNSDIRDWRRSSWTGSINNTTTLQVWSGVTVTSSPGSPCRIDKQCVSLPVEFSSQILTHMRMSDWGGSEFHRAFLGGMTVGVESCACYNLVMDSRIDLKDFAVFAAYWLDENCQQDESPCHGVDFDGNGSVGFSDMMGLALCWLDVLQ